MPFDVRAVVLLVTVPSLVATSAQALPSPRQVRKTATWSSLRSSRMARFVSPSLRATRGASLKLGRSAPLLDAKVKAADVVPAFILEMAPMERHLWYFKVARSLRGADAAAVRGYTASDARLGFGELKFGLEALGIRDWKAALLAMGVMVDRGGRQLLKGEGRPFQIDISDAHAWSTAHNENSRSGVYDAEGRLDPAREEAFLALLDPAGTDHITMDDFKAASRVLMAKTSVPGWQKRLNGGTFDRAWKSFMTIAGHVDPARGEKYVTRDEVRWFHDGTYFFRLAQARAAQ